MSESTLTHELDVVDIVGPDAVVTVHEPDEPAVAAALDGDGVVVGVELVDAANLPERDGLTYQLLEDEDREHAVVGATWDGATWQPPAPEPAAPVDDAGDLRRDLDMLLQLVLTSQDGEADGVSGAAQALAGMASRGTLTVPVVDGAFGWAVITSDERADLLDLIEDHPSDDEPDAAPEHPE